MFTDLWCHISCCEYIKPYSYMLSRIVDCAWAPQSGQDGSRWSSREVFAVWCHPMALCSWPDLLSGGSLQSCFFLLELMTFVLQHVDRFRVLTWFIGHIICYWNQTDLNAYVWIQLCRALSAVPMEHERLNKMLDKVAIYHQPKVCFLIVRIGDIFDGSWYAVSALRMHAVIVYVHVVWLFGSLFTWLL